MDASRDEDSELRGDPTYVYKPSLLGAPFAFRLTPTALAWSKGRFSDRVPYDRIRRLRLSYRPATMQSHRFLAEIWPVSGPKLTISSTSWRSMVEQERQDDAYRAFLTELHRRIAAGGGRPSLEAGSPPLMFWAGVVVFAGAGAALAALTFRALQFGQLSGAAVIGGFLALLGWQVVTFMGRNRPARYRPDAIPAQVLPKGSPRSGS
jgi:hypothetical protein